MSGGSAKASPTPRAVPPSGVRLPLFYGWVLVAVAFVTMAVGVNARTAFSLLFPAILDEFGWDRGMTAGVFSFGFLVSALVTPCIGWVMDLRGPRLVIELGIVMMGAGLLLAALVREPWQLYLSLGALVGGGVNCLAYTGQSLYLTNWFVRRRGLALSIAFSGVGIGAITVLPWVASLITDSGWRAACFRLGILVLVLLAPLNLLLKRRPEDLGLAADGMASSSGHGADRECRRPCLGGSRLDIGACLADRAFLVARCRLFLWAVHLVRGSGPSDQISDRGWFWAERGRIGAGTGEPRGDPGSDRIRAFV